MESSLPIDDLKTPSITEINPTYSIHNIFKPTPKSKIIIGMMFKIVSIGLMALGSTLLAMVDASIGGKTGIDFNNFKNQIGLFNEPVAVFIHTDFLETLPDRELLSGFAEVIKHAAINDASLFRDLEKNSINSWSGRQFS